MYRTTVAILVLIGALAFLMGCHHRDDDDKQKKLALHLPTGTPKRPQGMTALTVNSGAAQPFTKADVIAYFKTHNLPKNSASTTQIQVDTLEFLTSKEVSQRLQGVMTGLGDNDRVGFVILTGTFIFTGPGTDSKAARFNRAYAVFDAVTGNLLMIGTLEQRDSRQ
jgi:hypothetical protein